MLTWSGGEEEAGAELSFQALEYWLAGAGRGGQTPVTAGWSDLPRPPLPPRYHHSHLPNYTR